MLRVVKTESGYVRGARGGDARVTVFKGIPYADDTSGANRWRAPQPVKPWEGVKDCFEFAPITVQPIPGKDPDAFYSKEWHVEPEIPMSEDGSLVVNIWTPAKTGNEKLPVMIWVFGGGFREGYAHEMEFDGEAHAKRGVILVTVSYRLNVFGLLAHPEITAENPEAPTNFALLDQKAAFDWVKRNIAGFGGDPENITIFGQSAGAAAMLIHYTSPKTDGAFQRIIIQSAGGIDEVYPKMLIALNNRPLEEAERQGVEFFEKYLGVKTLAEARALPAEFVEQKYCEAGYFWFPVIDGKYIVEEPKDANIKGHVKDVPVMIGGTVGESVYGPREATEECITAWVSDNFGPYADQYMSIIRKMAGNDIEKLKEAATVSMHGISEHLLAEVLAKRGKKCYVYLFNPDIPGDNAGSFHSSDLWFEFETLRKSWRPFKGYHYDLSRMMCNYWTNFARTGDPNGNDADGTPMPEWTPYTVESPNEIHFFNTVEMDKTPIDEKTKFIYDINFKELGIDL